MEAIEDLIMNKMGVGLRVARKGLRFRVSGSQCVVNILPGPYVSYVSDYVSPVYYKVIETALLKQYPQFLPLLQPHVPASNMYLSEPYVLDSEPYSVLSLS